MILELISRKIKRSLSRIRHKILNLIFKYRLGKHRWSARFLFSLLRWFNRFETYINTERIGNYNHYVPKFLLRWFCVEKFGTDKGKIWEFSFKNKLIEKNNLNRVAAKKDFYIFRDKFAKSSDYVEKRLFSEMLEHFGSMIIKRLNTSTNEPDLTFLEESTLAVFIAHQITRVPAFYSAIEHFILYAYKKGLLKISDLDSLEFMRSQIVNNNLNISQDDLIDLDSNVHFDGANNHMGILSLLIAEDISEKIYLGNLHILDISVNSTDKFVISDNPVVLLDLKRREVLKYPAWWEINQKDMCIFLPISPTRCIFYVKSKIRDSVIETENNDLVSLVNFGQYLNASESVFSNNDQIIKRHIQIYASGLNKLKIV